MRTREEESQKGEVGVSVTFRLVTADEMNYVYGGWLASFRTSHGAGVVRMARYAEVYSDTITHILRRPGADVVVAELGGALCGFLCAERGHRLPVVHFVLVDKASRRSGIARGLFRAAGVDPMKPFVFTFKTGVITRLRAKIPMAKYDPLQARFDETQETA